ncbi:hypothetical protein MGN01_42700 [Methylobacterium gnaphalii]|uniref:Uncharacterized protein n=1 Tax=Methylobacterium gnaphalii TaxID=1010610 RepID=A0A512JR42_9HYPH|nr:hypothetical protein MGN01_42700 [Methylobacterium gnaphalii]GLS48853.1 hypothetical protein GCM10007885_17000 [Methylobacterium gnaphalii]
MEDAIHIARKSSNKPHEAFRFRKAKPFSDTDDFLSRIEKHDRRVQKSEEKSLNVLSDQLRKVRALEERAPTGWIKARGMLVDAVREVDAMLEPLGLGLSMADDIANSDLAGAVEVRLYRIGGGLPRSMLDITVGRDGQHRTRVFDTRLPVQVQLPPVASVTQEQYRAALMAFVHDVMRTTEPRQAQQCPHCAQPTLALHRVGSAVYDDDEGPEDA